MSTPIRPQVVLVGRALSAAQDTRLKRNALGFWTGGFDAFFPTAAAAQRECLRGEGRVRAAR